MAYDSDKKPSGLTALTTLANDDTIIVGDTSDANEVVKTISWTNLKTAITTLVEGLATYFDVSTDTSDAITEGATNLFMTSAERTKLSGVATGATANTGALADLDTVDTAQVDDEAITEAKLDVLDTPSDGEVLSYDSGTGRMEWVAPSAGTTVDVVSNVAQDRILGRATAGSGDSEELTAAQVRTLINVEDGANNYTHPDHTGDVTSSGDGATTIANNAVTFAKMQDISADHFIGRHTAGSGDPQQVSAAQARAILNVEDGATADQVASEVPFTPAGGIAATDVQAALQELDTEKAASSHTHAISDVTGLQTALDGKQPLDADLTALAAANNSAVLAATTASFLIADESKLDGIEAGADVTDTANVTAAGAVMDSEVNDLTFVKTLSDANVSTLNAGTSATAVPTAASLAGSYAGTKSVQMVVFEWATDVATGDGKYYFRVPPALNGMDIVNVHAEVITAGTTGTTDIQLHNVTDAVDILSTKLTIDSGETGSDTAATAAVINTANDDLATNDIIRVDVDAISTTAPAGLIVSFECRLP